MEHTLAFENKPVSDQMPAGYQERPISYYLNRRDHSRRRMNTSEESAMKVEKNKNPTQIEITDATLAEIRARQIGPIKEVRVLTAKQRIEQAMKSYKASLLVKLPEKWRGQSRTQMGFSPKRQSQG